jgi:hypothetical protein
VSAGLTVPRAGRRAGQPVPATAPAVPDAPDAAAAPRPAGGRRIAFEQALVAGGQLAAGLGNLAFALVAAHLLAPRGFAQLAAFLALYLLVHVPASSLSAGSALAPGLAARRRRRALVVGGAAGVAVAAAAVPLAGPAGVPAALLFVLAAGVPAAGWLALERGRLYGSAQHARAAASLAIEPVVRLALGIPLMLTAGAVGGAYAVIVGGYAALAVTRPFATEGWSFSPSQTDAQSDHPQGRGVVWATLAFLALAVVQNQDVVLANGLLDAGEAGRFAVLSTLGGAAAFATTTVPLVLLPRAARGERHALAAAVGAAALLGTAAVGVVALVPADLVGAAFGDRYAGVAEIAVPYVAAMALFGVARVLVAHRCATGGGAAFVVLVGAIAIGQAAAILVAGDDAATVARITLVATGVLALVAAGAAAPSLPGLRRPQVALPGLRRGPAGTTGPTPEEERDRRRVALGIAGLVVAALALRMVSTRGIWLDEATSITQSQMTLGGLLDSLRTTDVHPPLHHLLLWAIQHATGSTAELLMRLPSIVAGTALVPVLFLLGRDLYDRRAGMFAAALAAFSPFVVWYSQEARMYALFMLFASLAMLGQVRALQRGRKRDWALWAAATAGLLWTQYFGLFFTAVQQIGFLAAAWSLRRAGRPVRGFLAGWLGSAMLVALAVAPIAGFAADQFQANQSAGRGFNAPQQAGDVDQGRSQPGVYPALTNLVWAVWGYHSSSVMAAISSLWPAGILAALVTLGRRGRPLTYYVLACAFVPAALLFAIGFLKPFLFEVRFFAAAVPLLLLLVARGATGWIRGNVATAAVAFVLVGAFAVAGADQQLNGSNPRVYDFEGALTQIQRESRPGDVVLYEPEFLDDVVRYYGPGVGAQPLDKGVPPNHRGRVWVLSSFQDLPQHAQGTRDGLKRLERDYDVARTAKYPQIRIWLMTETKKREGAPRR